MFPSTSCSYQDATRFEDICVSSAQEKYVQIEPQKPKRGRPFGSGSRYTRTEELLQLAAEQVVAGASLRRVGNAYNIPRTTLHDYMMRKGLISQRSWKLRMMKLERQIAG